MDDLDRSLVELRRAVIDGAIQAEVGRWRAGRTTAREPWNRRSGTARAEAAIWRVAIPAADPHRASASSGRPRRKGERPEARTAAGATSLARKRAAWRRARGPVIAVIVAALTMLLML